MQDSLQVGDEVVTGGGIVGMVVSVGEDTVVMRDRRRKAQAQDQELGDHRERYSYGAR